MEQMVLYKGFRIRAYQDWSGHGWLRPSGRFRYGRALITPTPMLSTLPRPPLTQRQKPPLTVIKQMIDSPSATIAGPKTIQYRTPDSRLLPARQQIGQLGDIRCDPPRLIARPTSDGVLIAPAISQC